MPAENEISQVYIRNNDSFKSVIVETIRQNMDPLGNLHEIDEDLGSWSSYIDDDHHALINLSRRAFADSLQCAVSGMYQQAYSSLRVFLEVGFASVFFSVNEFKKKLWLSNKFDYSWKTGLSPDEGMLSPKFVSVFNESLLEASSEFSQQASEVYRECSEFIHGKHSRLSMLPTQVKYDEEIFSNWAINALRAGKSVLFLLWVRYGDMENQEIEDIIQAHFSHLKRN